VRVAVIPPLVTGEDPGETPNTQETSAVVNPSPDVTALSAASRRARKGVGSAESVDGADGVFFVGEARVVMEAEKSVIFARPMCTA
jgi:hypothetical protein